MFVDLPEKKLKFILEMNFNFFWDFIGWIKQQIGQKKS